MPPPITVNATWRPRRTPQMVQAVALRDRVVSPATRIAPPVPCDRFSAWQANIGPTP